MNDDNSSYGNGNGNGNTGIIILHRKAKNGATTFSDITL